MVNIQLLFQRTGSPIILKLSLQHKVIKLYKIDINDDPGFTLTYFTARSNLVLYVFIWEILAAIDDISKRFMYLNKTLTHHLKHLLRSRLVNKKLILCGVSLKIGIINLLKMVLVT